MAETYNFGQVGTLPAEVFQQQQELNRQQRMAQMLMQQGQQQPQGQMISGRYVAPSIFQNLASLAQTAAGTYLQNKGDEKALNLSKALKSQYTDELNQFNELLTKNPMEAYSYAAQAYNPKLQEIGMKKMMPEEITLSEGQKRFVTMPDGSVKELASGGDKYHPPIQIDTGTAIELRDPRDPTKVLSRMAKSQMPTAGQVLETENGPMLINTRTGQAQPIMAGGVPVAGGGKLTETQGNATGFGLRAKEANQIATDLEKKGVAIPGKTSTVVSGIAGMTPFVGDKYSEATKSLFNVLPEAVGGLSSDQQLNSQARKNFVSAVLRKESGAAISPQEYATEERKYFPQLGDSDAVIKQKQNARNSAIKSLEIQAGPGARFIKQAGEPNKVVNFNDLP